MMGTRAPRNYTSRIGPAQISELLGQHVASLQVGRQKNVRLSGNRRMDAFDESSFFADIVVLGEGDRGRVTEINLRSTRIKRLDGILVSIPNASIANMKIINESAPRWPNVRLVCP